MFIKFSDREISLPRTLLICLIGALIAAQVGGSGGFVLGWLTAVFLFSLTFVTDRAVASIPNLRSLFETSGELGPPRQIMCDCLRVGAKGTLVDAVCGGLGIIGGSLVCFLGWIGHYLEEIEDKAERQSTADFNDCVRQCSKPHSK